MVDAPNLPDPQAAELTRLQRVATAVYLLQALSLFMGFTLLAGVIVNYVKLSDARGTWLESHFRWQIRTFWWVVFWSLLGTITIFVGVGYLILLATAIWLVYRVAFGWLRLSDQRSVSR